MKKTIAFTATLLLLLVLTGCDRTIDKWTADLGERVLNAAQNYMDSRSDDEKADSTSGNEVDNNLNDNDNIDTNAENINEGVDITDSSVILTVDYKGIEQIHEFFYDADGNLSSAVVSMDCGDSDRIFIGRQYFEYANEGITFFKNINTEENIITGEYTDAALETYRYYDKEELAEALKNTYFEGVL